MDDPTSKTGKTSIGQSLRISFSSFCKLRVKHRGVNSKSYSSNNEECKSKLLTTCGRDSSW